MDAMHRRGMLFGLALGVCCLSASSVWALGESSARAAGMGRTYTAVARNLDAVGWNPANLGLPGDRKLSIALFSAGTGAGNDVYTLGDYNRYNGKSWSEAAKREILNGVPPEGVTFSAAGEAGALGISYGQYAFRANLFTYGRGRLPRDPMELALFGNEPDRTYRVDGAEGEGEAAWCLSASGAYPLQVERLRSVSVGATVRYLRGIGYFEVQDAQGTLVTREAGIELQGAALSRRAEGGTGFSVDLGAAAQIDGQWTVGLALVHLGSMSWDRDARENRGRVRADSLKVSDLTDAEAFDDLFDPTDQERALRSFGTWLPAALRFGVAWKKDRLLFGMDWEQGLNNSPGSVTRPRVSAGGEYMLARWLPLRGGLSLGGRSGRTYAVGFGLGVKRVAFDLGLWMRRGIVPNAATGAGMAAELKLGF